MSRRVTLKCSDRLFEPFHMHMTLFIGKLQNKVHVFFWLLGPSQG
jgi:hypothetical protein